MATSAPLPQVPVPDDIPGAVRRVNLRRSSSGFGSSVRPEGEPREIDEVDAAVEPTPDPRTMRDATLSSMANQPQPLRLPAPNQEDEDSARQRLHEAQMAGDVEYARHYRQELVWRLRLRNIALDAIARQLGVSLATVKSDLRDMRARLREEAGKLHILDIVGGQRAFYEDATALALRVVSSPNTPTGMRLAGLRTALAAQADYTRFLSTAGVFDALQYRKGEDGSSVSEVERLMERTEAALERLMQQQEEEDPPPPPKPPRRSRIVGRNPNGFAPMTFSDPDASSSSGEVQEL